MNNKIKIYESLLSEEMDLSIECNDLYISYLREFGDDVNKLYSLKVDTITLKKKIAYCNKCVNNNKDIISADMEKYIKNAIKTYKARLAVMKRHKKLADEAEWREPSFEDKRKIKSIYYKIVHLIHPDLHPEYDDNNKIKRLWDEAVNAYKEFNYYKLKRTFDFIIIETSKYKRDDDIYIDDIDEKIKILKKEIKDIKNNNPYKFKFILDDDIEISEFHKKLNEEIETYKEYVRNLEYELSKFDIIEGFIGDA